MADQRQVSGNPTSVAAVVFDLFNTLTAPIDDLVFRSSLKEMARAVGTGPVAFTQGWLDLWRQLFDGTLPTTEAGVRAVCDAIGVPVHAEAISEAVKIRAEFLRGTLRPRVDAVATLTQLRALGLRTALISNCSPGVPVLRPTTPYADVMGLPLFSCVEGLLKPDPAIFLRACQRLDVDPQACVYVGDGGDHELTSAESVGMRAVLITTPEERTAAYDSERASWRGEAIEALSKLSGLTTGAEAAAD
ncbi:MAG: HAD family hydrolase [Chloroflexi bacterium]|nr:HAD family hydrolase [Chloroflexota bacterium]